jgi:uncharacterized protein
MPGQAQIARMLRPRLLEALADTPVVLIHGPRQCGKTTLAQTLKQYTYLTFDDEVQRAAAEADPIGFVAGLPNKVILDEIQRVPRLFTSLKAAVDQNRQAGRFLLTGSANVLLAPTLSDSLAGRMEILRLHPLAQCEIAGRDTGFLQNLFTTNINARRYSRLDKELPRLLIAGGYPAALARSSATRRAEWYRAYIETLVQRDVRDMSRISSLDSLSRLLQLAASQTARLLNVSELSAPFQLSRPSIKDYLALLERVFLIDVMPPWHNNRLSRLIKTPKLHVSDSGLAASLLGINAEGLTQDRELMGQILETFVFNELRRMASWQETPVRFYHYRDKDRVEVDLVLERGSRELSAVEVKTAATVSDADFRGLRKIRDATGNRFKAGVLLYDGESSVGFGDRLYAVPITGLWRV